MTHPALDLGDNRRDQRFLLTTIDFELDNLRECVVFMISGMMHFSFPARLDRETTFLEVEHVGKRLDIRAFRSC